MNKEQIDLINDLKRALNKISKDEELKDVAKKVVNNFHEWLISK